MDSSQQFLTCEQCFKAWYYPKDRIAVFVKNFGTGQTRQRIVTVKEAVTPKFQAWIQSLDCSAGNVYSSVNVFRSVAGGRTKANIRRILGVHMEIDHDGDAALQRLLRDTRVPSPNILINSSPGRYQLLWKALHLTVEQAEGVNKALAYEFGADTAATDATRVLRIPGLRNWKYTQPFVVTARRISEKIHSLADFQLNLVPVAPVSPAFAHPARFAGRQKITQLERDWAMVMDRLSRGEPRDVIQRDLELSRPDKPRPAFLRGHLKDASQLLPRVHRVASLLKRWLLGTHPGAISHQHLVYYLDEFTFRFNRRRSRSRGKLFFRLVEQAVTTAPEPYHVMVQRAKTSQTAPQLVGAG